MFNKIKNFFNRSKKAIDNKCNEIYCKAQTAIANAKAEFYIDKTVGNVSMALIIERKLIPNTFVKTTMLQVVMCLIVLSSYFIGSSFISIEQITVVKWIISAVAATFALLVVCCVIYSFIDCKTAKRMLIIAQNKLRNR